MKVFFFYSFFRPRGLLAKLMSSGLAVDFYDVSMFCGIDGRVVYGFDCAISCVNVQKLKMMH